MVVVSLEPPSHQQRVSPYLGAAARADEGDSSDDSSSGVAALVHPLQPVGSRPPAARRADMPTPQQPQHGNGNTNGNEAGGSPSSSHSNSNDMSGDAEGVWSADIDQAFHEALEIYPPCGRRKIILSEEGKMYGRNELIARYIKIRSGKTRTRKQVSSHIQVLARKQNREHQSKLKTQDGKVEDPVQSTPSNVSEPTNGDAFKLAASASRSSIDLQRAAASNFLQHSGSPTALDATKYKALAEAAAAASSAVGDQSVASTLQLANSQLDIKRKSSPITAHSGSSSSAAAAAVAAVAASTAAGAHLQWPYNMIPNALNNNFYGNLTDLTTSPNDDALYSQVAATAAALSAQQRRLNAAASFPPSLAAVASSAAAHPTSQLLGNLHGLGKLLPQLPAIDAASMSLPNADRWSNLLAERTIAAPKLLLCAFSAFVERRLDDGHVERVDLVKTISFDSVKQKFPSELADLFRTGPAAAFFLVKCWANVAFNVGDDDTRTQYAVDSTYDSAHSMDIAISSKVCSFSIQQVEKVEVYSSTATSTQMPQPIHHYRLDRSPMCDYMVSFIKKLKTLESIEQQNAVLENFTVLQIITDKQTNETLMVIAFNFAIAPEPESSCRVYRMVQ